MALKPRHKRRLFWTIIGIIACLGIGIIIIPPMMNLNNLKPKIEQIFEEKTGYSAKINGDIHFSLLGKSTIVANDIVLENGTIKSAKFYIPLSYLLGLKPYIPYTDVEFYDANITLSKLSVPKIKFNLTLHNSSVFFMDKEYEVIEATLYEDHFNGIIRTDNHKYELDAIGNEFFIKNQNDKLQASGYISETGETTGKMSIETDNINKLFNFDTPKITKTIKLETDFYWNGDKELKFTNIKSDTFSGNIELFSDGSKDIELYSDSIIFDFSFLLDKSKIFYNTNFDIDFSGNLKFQNFDFSHIKLQAKGISDRFEIYNIIADDKTFTGGYIDKNGGHNIQIKIPYAGKELSCIFSGTPTNWECKNFSYNGMTGDIQVSNKRFYITVQSNATMPTSEYLQGLISSIGTDGEITFTFADIGGKAKITSGKYEYEYDYLLDKELGWFDKKFEIFPDFMYKEKGNFQKENQGLKFTPYSGGWTLYITKDYFQLNGNNIKDLFPDLDLTPIKDSSYMISGNYRDNDISNLFIRILNHEFKGSAIDKNITLKTNLLNIDSFVSQDYIDSYDEMEFTTQMPILTLFNLPYNISLSASELVYSGSAYKNFVYSLRNNQEMFSITDNDKGSLLVTITKDKTKYEAFIQTNNFLINDYLLSPQMPLNVKDSSITSEIRLNTHGNIAHDIKYNLSGTFDLTFSGGEFAGIGIDYLYANAQNMDSFNAEYFIADALDGGSSALKKMKVIGTYKDGEFKTTSPITISLRHTEMAGNLEIIDKQMYASFELLLRGTSPSPKPIDLRIISNSGRDYSLSDIMSNFDANYMKEFTATHQTF